MRIRGGLLSVRNMALSQAVGRIAEIELSVEELAKQLTEKEKIELIKYPEPYAKGLERTRKEVDTMNPKREEVAKIIAKVIENVDYETPPALYLGIADQILALFPETLDEGEIFEIIFNWYIGWDSQGSWVKEISKLLAGRIEKPTCACNEPMIYPEQKGGNCGYCGKPIAEKRFGDICEKCGCEKSLHNCPECGMKQPPQECKQIEQISKLDLGYNPPNKLWQPVMQLANKLNEVIAEFNKHNRGE